MLLCVRLHPSLVSDYSLVPWGYKNYRQLVLKLKGPELHNYYIQVVSLWPDGCERTSSPELRPVANITIIFIKKCFQPGKIIV